MTKKKMTAEEFKALLDANSGMVEKIKYTAHLIHDSVNQNYDDKPYSFHLDAVVDILIPYIPEVCPDEGDVVPLIFGAFFHDTIEDARMTYNDVMKEAKKMFDDDKALLATEIVFALTNDKGRTRAERAGEKYYEGIRQTPYAPLVKACDRLANVSYSVAQEDDRRNSAMKVVYRREMPHFLESIISPLAATDPRFSVPKGLIRSLMDIVE